MEPKKGFFDKIDNAFFSVIDVFLVVLEERGWNIPEETRFLYHTAIFVFVFWLGFPLILRYFVEFELLVFVLVMASFCIANIMPIRKLLGYYSSDEKIHGLVSKIKNNQVSIKEVAKHLGKNLLPPYLTLSIIRAYRAKCKGIPPEIIRTLIRQPQENAIFEELIKEPLNQSDFSLLMRKYRNRIPKALLLKTVESQKMDAMTIRDLLFMQENAYQAINEIGKKAEDTALMDFVIAEKHKYKQRTAAKNFFRLHHLAISIAVAAIVAAVVSLPFLQFAFEQWAVAVVFAVTCLVLFELMFNFAVKAVYFRL